MRVLVKVVAFLKRQADRNRETVLFQEAPRRFLSVPDAAPGGSVTGPTG